MPEPALLRILDANANRAREALRVLDDVARFALDDAALTADLKTLRHAVLGALARAMPDAGHLLASRDTEGDVGTGLTTPSEFQREGLAQIAQRNAARLTEALRSLEEALKALGDPAAAADIEQARYRAYTLHRTLALRLGCASRGQRTLCVLITQSLCTHHAWDTVARRAIEGGADALQLREKDLSDRAVLERARALVAIAREMNPAVQVWINDRPHVALLARAHGVHVGQTDLAVADVRAIVGLGMLVGVSTSRLDEALQASDDGADCCGLGPMFPSTTKAKPTIAGPDYLRAYLAEPRTARIPHLAISGIDAARAGELARLGCRGVAVSSAVCSAPDPREAARAIVASMRDNTPPAA